MNIPILKYIRRLIIFCVLTLLSQVGGLVYLLYLISYKILDKKNEDSRLRKFSKLPVFLAYYSITIFFLVPLIAKPLGRVPLPIMEQGHLRPLNILTCLLNRNYVRPALRDAALKVAASMNSKYPGTTINYLEGNFPFYDGFPLLPHRSHSDGKKLDLSFCYNNSQTGQAINGAPASLGYGLCEEPSAGELNTAEDCEAKGFWQYSFVRNMMPQSNKKDYAFNAEKTAALVNFFAGDQAIGRIFIEPHLKTRLRLSNEKVKFHGCQAVRHDDHFHVQLY